MPPNEMGHCARLQHYINQEFPEVQAGFRKGRGTSDHQIANICWVIEKAREFQKNTYFCFTYYTKATDCMDHNKLWTILQEMGIPDHLTCLLRNLYTGQEATFRTGHETDWFQIGEGVSQGCILSPCLFNFYAEYIMRHAGLEEAQVGIKIVGRVGTLHKTRVPTFTITIQHSFGSFGHSDQSRKRNKRNPNWKRRSKTLTVCR